MTWLWVVGLLRRRLGRICLVAVGVAVCVAMLANLGTFFASSMHTMTQRAIRTVAVDWQVQVVGGSVADALAATKQAPGTVAALPVGFADSSHLRATVGGTTQVTGAGKVLGIPASYAAAFPDAIRVLSGAGTGILVAQQTAANLHVAPGDTLRIDRVGLTPVTVTVDGVVELPQIDSLFQTVGAPPLSQPTSPPDNVVLVPLGVFHHAFDPLARVRPDLVSSQIHVRRDHQLPSSPPAAFVTESASARNLEVSTSGTLVVGDNLGAALDAAREDALYSRVLFLFLGLPGAILAAALCAALAATGAPRRRRDFALLRTRGATRRAVLGLAVAESGLVALIGCLAGIGLAVVVGQTLFGSLSFAASTAGSLGWLAASCLVGLVTAVLAVVVPARRDLASVSVVDAGQLGSAPRPPLWMRLWLDLVILAGAAALFWVTSRRQYTLVLAPEGVPTISVSYVAFLGPLLLWLGVALVTWRIGRSLLGRDGRWFGKVVRPMFGHLSGVVSSTLARQSGVVVRTAVLIALAYCFAMSTSTFNATYQQQADVDAQLTNGANVTVAEPPGSNVPASAGNMLASLPGVRGVQPLQHRFAYVGVDLQDLYGIDPTTIGQATTLLDPYFQQITASQAMANLAARPDAILVSAETVNDFQLVPGDTLRLRLQTGTSQSFTPVTFHYAGIVNEFPTAPKDSFLVANASYIAQQTGDASVAAFLVDTASGSSRQVAADIRQQVGASATVTTIDQTRGLVGSTLTSVDLSGLTRLELAYAFVIVAAAGGIIPALTMTERRRTLTVAVALRASRRQTRAFGLAEAVFVYAVGLAAGGLAGWVLSSMLVKVLTGVFDPPPSSLAIPWGYLAAVAVSTGLLVLIAALTTSDAARRGVVQRIREL